MTIDREHLVGYLHQQQGVNLDDLEDASEPLFSTGILDSFAMVDLLAYLEETAGFKVRPQEVNLDNLDSIERIVRYVESRLGEAARD
jgi:acyl carrier protein